jgi:pimeloyl-ACP methyl ester carboxylesterase
MPVLERDRVSLYYEEYGEGFPLLLFAPGGMRSEMQLWRGRPDAPDEKLPWIDPTLDLADGFRVIAFDQRNAGRSRAPVRRTDSWETYASDAVALLDHLGIERTHAMGGCIGSAYVLGLIRAAPGRVAAGVLQNPIGLTADNRGDFVAMFDQWATAIGPAHPEADSSTWPAFREAMFGGDFVFSVSRDFVRRLEVPLLVLAGDDHFHPPAVAHEIADLAPHAELVEKWAGEEMKPATRDKVRAFLSAHTPDAV